MKIHLTGDRRRATENHDLRSVVCRLWSRRAFTLIEMLVVISIIGILAGLLLPAIKGAITKGKVSRARTEVKSIENAVRSYYTEYGMMPTNYTSDVSYGTLAGFANGNLMNILIAATTNANPRAIVFLEIPSKSLSGGNFVDPWQNQYEITIDANYNNICNGPAGTPAAAVTNKSVIAWSLGPDKTQNTVDDILSWQ